MRAQGWVRRMWAGEAGASGAVIRLLLLPAEGLFRLGLGARERRYGKPGAVVRAPIPVVSVGNLSVGGTGKTPLASWVLSVLRERGASPALVARGYGEDELLLHRRWTPGIPVVADPDRHAGVVRAAQEGATVAVLDDGFQHRRLAREVDLVLVGAEEGLPGALLPRGPFREPREALGRAHGVVVTRKEAPESQARAVASRVGAFLGNGPVGRVHLRAGGLRPLSGEDPGAPPASPVVVATGVARPTSVAEGVRSLGVEVASLEAFPDHHDFTGAEVRALLRRAAGRTLVVTEKDAVKLERLPEAAGGDIRVLEQELVWEEGRSALEALVGGVLGDRP